MELLTYPDVDPNQSFRGSSMIDNMSSGNSRFSRMSNLSFGQCMGIIAVVFVAVSAVYFVFSVL